jgi:hypothetical protein
MWHIATNISYMEGIGRRTAVSGQLRQKVRPYLKIT